MPVHSESRPPAPDEILPVPSALLHTWPRCSAGATLCTSWGKAFTALWVADAASQTDLLVDLIYQFHDNALLAIRNPSRKDWIEPALPGDAAQT